MQRDLYGNKVNDNEDVGFENPQPTLQSRDARSVGKAIEKEVNESKIPYVTEAILDDFNEYSGRIFIGLKMTRNMGKYWFEPPGSKPLRSISASVRGILKKYPIDVYGWETPNATYDSFGEFDGYDKDYIQFDYDVL